MSSYQINRDLFFAPYWELVWMLKTRILSGNYSKKQINCKSFLIFNKQSIHKIKFEVFILHVNNLRRFMDAGAGKNSLIEL